MKISEVLARVDKAIANVENRSISELVKVLKDTREILNERYIGIRTGQITSAKEAWTAYREYHDRISEICRIMCIAKEPRAQNIHLKYWSVFGQNWEPAQENIRAEVKYQINEDDWEDTESFSDVETNRYDNNTYANKTMSLELNSSWLWNDNWIPLAEVERIRTDLWWAERRLTDWEEAIPKRMEDLATVNVKLHESRTRVSELKVKLEEAEKVTKNA